jgi:arsenate reductase (glutaredoxin)
MSKTITVYEKPTCTTCRNMTALLVENGVKFDKVNYFTAPFTVDSLRDLIRKTGLKPAEVLRKRELKDSGLSETASDEEIIKAMVENPNLIQRPIVELGSKAVLARPIEKVRELVDF